ncbi:MAG: hypothetical protein HFH45_05200, partial [Bacilli bacterium]|nr:hypothetical protein [Bacilli bacterium]
DTVNLNHTATKDGFKFLGWSTNKDAVNATDILMTLQMPANDITLYAIYKDITPPTCNLTVTKATIDKVTVNADCQDISGIKEYRYMIGDIDEVVTENTYNLNNYNLSELIIEVTDNANNKGSFNINQDNLQKGYQLIYSALNEGYKDLNGKKDNYKNNLLNKTYPIGSIYITEKNTNPSETLGGTWEAYSKGRSLVGVDPNDINFNEVNKIGGSKTNTLAVTNLPLHTHSIPVLSGTAASAGAHTNSIPSLTGTTNSAGSHNHDWKGFVRVTPIASETYVQAVFGKDSTDSYIKQGKGIQSAGAHTHTLTTVANTTGSSGNHTHAVTTNATNTGSIGSGTTFSNLSPYITVYIWKRIS